MGFGLENPYKNKPVTLFRPSNHRSVGVSHGEGTNGYMVKEYVVNQGRFY